MENIYLIVAPSGAGKTTLVDNLSLCGLKVLDSYTTRPKRDAHEGGHVFVSKEEFDALEDRVAYTLYNGYEYCATSKQVENSDLYVIDPAGVDEFRTLYRGKKGVVVFALDCSAAERVKRMRKRGDKWVDIKDRILNDNIAFADMKSYADKVFNAKRSEKDLAKEVMSCIREEEE